MDVVGIDGDRTAKPTKTVTIQTDRLEKRAKMAKDRQLPKQKYVLKKPAKITTRSIAQQAITAENGGSV